jgi:hypothetical protein
MTSIDALEVDVSALQDLPGPELHRSDDEAGLLWCLFTCLFVTCRITEPPQV